MEYAIHCQDLYKRYADANGAKQKNVIETEVLKGVDLKIKSGEQVAILGQSGSGKSTLLHLLAMLDDLSSGDLHVCGQSAAELDENQRAQFRNVNMGFIYQFHHLLMEFSAVENVAMPLLINGMDRIKALKESENMLNQVGLAHRLTHLPSQLSGGERQRVAIARALINKPKLVLADEPTGNLDKSNAEQVFELFLKLNQTHNTTLVVVTHDQELAQRFDRVIRLDDGKVV